LAGGVALDNEAAEQAVGALATRLGLGLEEAAAGIARVAGAEMAQAARVVTIERGIDPRELALVAFGGAGPLHAAQIAEELGITRVIAPAVSGVLSALGLAVSERRRDLVESVLLTGEAITATAVADVVRRLVARGRDELGEPAAEIRATYDLRYTGQAFELAVEGDPEPDPADLRRAFDRAHSERYGYEDPRAELELVTVRVAVAMAGADPHPPPAGTAPHRGSRRARFGSDWEDAAVFGPGETELEGPAIVELPGATVVVPPGWAGRADAEAVVIER